MNEILITVFGFLGILITQYFQYKKSTFNQNKIEDLVTFKDKKQDEAINRIETKVNDIFEYVDNLEHKVKLIAKIRKKVNEIVSNNKLDNSEFMALLSNTRENYICLIENILNTEIQDIYIEDVKNDIKTLAKQVLNSVNQQNLRVSDKFLAKVKNDVVLPLMNVFCMRLETEILKDKKVFNGTFSNIALNVITNLVTETIKIYRDCKNDK
jgi:L-fucose isomerase-like protein